mgnify:CR=1 FL=1
MNKKTYFIVTTLVFVIVAVLHLTRIFLGWEASMGGWTVPQWVSWIALAGSSFLAYSGFNQTKQD